MKEPPTYREWVETKPTMPQRLIQGYLTDLRRRRERRELLALLLMELAALLAILALILLIATLASSY